MLDRRQAFSNRSEDTHSTSARTRTGTGSSLIDVRQIRLSTKTTKPKQSEINLTNYTFNSIFFDHNDTQNSLKQWTWLTIQETSTSHQQQFTQHWSVVSWNKSGFIEWSLSPCHNLYNLKSVCSWSAAGSYATPGKFLCLQINLYKDTVCYKS